MEFVRFSSLFELDGLCFIVDLLRLRWVFDGIVIVVLSNSVFFVVNVIDVLKVVVVFRRVCRVLVLLVMLLLIIL